MVERRQCVRRSMPRPIPHSTPPAHSQRRNPRSADHRKRAVMSVHSGSSLVFNIRDYGLDRKPGASHAVTRTVEAPERLGTEVIAVAESTPIQLELKLESVVEGIYVSGTIETVAHGE